MAAPSTTLHEPAFTASMVDYDFEQYALSHGIPETLDPLPYRKAGSVFATGEEAEPVMTSAKHDPRLRTVVCRHWLRDLCMKGKACEFLHQYDLSKMPLCRHGDRCKLKDCPFRHISEADRLECVFYSQGFCIHGPFCRYKHLRRDREELPAVADFTLGLSQMQAGKDGVQQRRPAPKPNEFYKVSLCKHFLQGDCPFGDGCHFAHGEHELKRFPRGPNGEATSANNDDGGGVGADAELTENMFATDRETTTVEYFQGGEAGGGRPSPLLEPEHAAFFALRAATQRDVTRSTVDKEWWVCAKHAETMNEAYRRTSGKVMLYLTVGGSHHVQAAALMASEAAMVVEDDDVADDDDDEFADDFTHRITLEYYRTMELPHATVLRAAPDVVLPDADVGPVVELSPADGEAVMKAAWNSPLVSLYESYDGTTEPPTDLLGDPRAFPPHARHWPTGPGPGFLFGCTRRNMDECLGRGVLGLPHHMRGPAENAVRPGSAVFLHNVDDRLLFGVFEALTPVSLNLEPTFLSKNPKATSSPLPVQIRFRVALECPPLEEQDNPILGEILRGRGDPSCAVGPLTHAQCVALGSLLATQCGAMQYMVEYEREQTSTHDANATMMIQAPPIALPPRKIDDANHNGAAAGGA